MSIPDAISSHTRDNVVDKHTVRQLLLLFALTAIVTTLLSYGGIRSPDSEVVFLTADALATEGTFGLTKDIPGLKGFGLPEGRDGKYYSIFGPGQSVFAVPLVKLAHRINETGWYRSFPDLIPVSHYVGNGLVKYVDGLPVGDPGPHALRTIVSSFNVVVCSLCACFFFLLVRMMTNSDLASWLVSILLAFGSLLLPYSGTFFSEPLATLFVVLSLYCLVWNDVHPGVPDRQKYLSLVSSGIFLGLAMTVHISAALYGPFFLAYALYPFLRTERTVQRFLWVAALFSAGIVVFLATLGYYDYVRFGNIFETGRTASAQLQYAAYVAPWRGLYGLLFGSGKGILWFCPAVIAAAVVWRPFHRQYRFLSYTIITAVLFRVFFLACRSDWHGGFCLGPRYLLMTIPLLTLPLGIVVAQWVREENRRKLRYYFVLVFLCVSEQLYFSIGEIFSFLHTTKWNYSLHGVNVFKRDALYLDWDKSPLAYLLDYKR
ncbi:MAG TPA: phospholipid carrier-dependent glycosyltransferase, partial [Bacteroidota bacterium]